MSSRARRLRRGPPEFRTYTLTAKGELLGTVDVRPGARLAKNFRGYFHPTLAFSRVWPLFEALDCAEERYGRLYMVYERAGFSTPSCCNGLDVKDALAKTLAAADIAEARLAGLGLELTDAQGQRLDTGQIEIERTRLEEEVELYESGSALIDESPFDEIDAGVDVSPYRLGAGEPRKDRPESASRKERWRLPWTPEREHEAAEAEKAAEAAAAEFDAKLPADGDGDEEGEVRWEDDYEWEDGHPSFEDKMELLRRAARGHPRDTFAWVLDVASPRHYDDDEDRDEWVKAVQRARDEGVLEAELAQFLIWKIVMNAHEYRHKTVDPVLVELDHRMDVVAKKYGVEADELDKMAEPPAEWIEIDEAWDERQPQIVREVLLAAGEAGIEAAMRERAEEFGARMKGWEELVEGEKRPG